MHGYFLGDSGSGIYVAQLARELVREGHEVTLICQEYHHDKYDFIDSVYAFDPENTRPRLVHERDRVFSGSCRLVRPDIGGRLLTYVDGDFKPFESRTYIDAGDAEISEYVERNIKALSATFDTWPQDIVQANHAVMQPYVTRKALAGRTPYCVTLHGSSLNFTVKKDARMIPYFIEGLADARAVVSPGRATAEQASDVAAAAGLVIEDKVQVIPPGVESCEYPMAASKASLIRELSKDLDPESDDIILFAGRLLWTKGLQYAVAALPHALSKRASMHMFIAGDGPMRAPLEELIWSLDCGDLEKARRLVSNEEQLQANPDYGPVIPEMDAASKKAYLSVARNNLLRRVHLLGRVPHEKIPSLAGAADVMIAPSVFPEAFGLVMVEALAGGAMPVATYQSGLRDTLDILAEELGDEGVKRLAPGLGLTVGLADDLVSVPEKFPTRDEGFRTRLHDIAARHFSWEAVVKRYLELI